MGVVNKTIIDRRRHPRCHIPMNSTKHCSCLTSSWYCHLVNSSKHNIVYDTAHWPHGMKTWHHPQNWKYITYRKVIRKGPSHDYRRHAQEIWWTLTAQFELHKQTDRQTDKLTTILHTPTRSKVTKLKPQLHFTSISSALTLLLGIMKSIQHKYWVIRCWWHNCFSGAECK